jgi:oligoribonuclease
MLLFADVETTGLSPEDDKLMEVAFVITDDMLQIRDEISAVIHRDYIEYDRATNRWEPPFGINKVVVDMHNDSGLWRDSYNAPRSFTTRAVENMMIDWIEKRGVKDLPLVGNTIGFDRSFLRLHMPRLHELFHYRSLDISSIKIAANLWNPLDESEKPENNKLHRALPDCHDSIRELDAYRRIIFHHDFSDFEKNPAAR